VGNLTRVLKSVPKRSSSAPLQLRLRLDAFHSQPQGRKTKPRVLNTVDLPVSDVWQRASDADADLDLDYDTLNPHFEYIDEDSNQRTSLVPRRSHGAQRVARRP